MIQFFNVKKSYGGTLILSIPESDLPEGCYWLQGVNGSGKTTLLRMIAGLLSFEGDIALNGCKLHKSPIAYRRTVSWADAEPLYPAFLSGDDLLAFYREVRGASEQQTKALVTGFGMQSYLSTRIGTWSAGMVKKLSLVLAFTGNPTLIVLDELLVTLDQASVLHLYQLIREARAQGISFLFTSHQEPDLNALPLNGKLSIANSELQEMSV